jgi:hypothetical protein
MVSFRMLRRVALVRTGVSNELSVFFIRVKRISEVGTTLAVTNNRHTLCSVRRLLVTASVVSSSPILVTLMIEPHGVTSQKTPFFICESDYLQNVGSSTSHKPLGFHSLLRG